MKTILILVVVIGVVFLVGWIGLSMPPAPFPAYTAQTFPVDTMPLPENLPEPVERFYRQVYGERIPVIKTAVLSGRASMRPFGPFYLPARFRFTHVAGEHYRHYIEATFFGLPFMKVNESYIDQHARMELPFAIDEGPKLDQAAVLGMWSETFWFPAVFLTDSRVVWEPIDENMASLTVPFGCVSEHFIVRFDPESGLVTWIESMRYKGSASQSKVLWLNQATAWGERDGKPFLVSGAVTWMDDGKPWAVFTVEDVVLNADIYEYIRARGP